MKNLFIPVIFLLLFSGRCSGLLLQNTGQFICSGNQQEYLCRAVRRKSVPLFLKFMFMFSFMNMQSREDCRKRWLEKIVVGKIS